MATYKDYAWIWKLSLDAHYHNTIFLGCQCFNLINPWIEAMKDGWGKTKSALCSKGASLCTDPVKKSKLIQKLF